MMHRTIVQALFFFSPTLSFLLSLLLIAPARSQELPALVRSGSDGSSAAQAPGLPGRFLIVYRQGQISAETEDLAHALGATTVARHDLFGISIVNSLSEAARAQLALDPRIEAIVPDVLLHAHAVITRPVSNASATAPDALYHSPQGWAVRQVGGFGADGTAAAPNGPWNTTRGKGVRIAILDSGIDPAHPDLAANLALNLSEVRPEELPSPCDDGSVFDQQGHGTWTASLAAGALGPASGLTAGVAPEASILNIKVLERLPAAPSAGDPTGCRDGQASGLLSWALQGIADAITHRADILSMSFGALVDVTTGTGAGEKAIFDRATQAAFNAGLVIIAAAGNDADNLSSGEVLELPAQARDVLAIVASTNPACAQNLKAGAICVAGPVTMPYYSNFGAPLNALAAPGGSYPAAGSPDPDTTPNAESGWITGACSSGKPFTASGVPSDPAHSLGCFNLGHAAYVQAMGTSASAPLVAGAAALLIAAHPTWTPAHVVSTLRTSAIQSSGISTPQANVSILLTNAN